MYAFVLLTHSWLRHLVLLFGVWLLVTSFRALRHQRPWSPADERTHVHFLSLLDTQLLLGLLLYFWLSPVAATARADLAASMKLAELRFFGVEHIFAMLVAVVVAHVGRVRSRKQAGVARQRITFRAQLLWLLLTLAGIPWPGLDVARPLFRM